MNVFTISCLVSILALVSASNDTNTPIELEPNEEPFAGLKRGPLSQILPKRKTNGPKIRIVSGNFAEEKQLPYQVALLIGFENTPSTHVYAFCGGTILGSEWIITAAHCTSGARTIEVRLGSVWRDSPQRVSWGYQNHIHPGWTTNGDDIALVKMQWVDFSPYMAPAALPARNGQYTEYVSARVVASGWGSVRDGGPVNDRLKYAIMSVIDKDACAAVYGSNAKRPNIMCTQSSSSGATCSGDSGGPLVLENTRTLIGVVTFGASVGCAKGLPDGFSRITNYLDWINDVSGISW